MFFLYIMKDQGLPVGEIFEEWIKDIPTSWFSKNLDDTMSKHEEDVTAPLPHQFNNLSDRIFPEENSIASLDSLGIPLTLQPAAKQDWPNNVPALNLDSLCPWK